MTTQSNVNLYSTKEDTIRSVLESIVFRVFRAYQLTNGSFLLNRTAPPILRYEHQSPIEITFTCFWSRRINGGVAKNDFICQSLADLLGLIISRNKAEMSTLGVAYMAGIKCGEDS